MKIRAGDSVVVISGKDKGKTGTVLRVLESKGRLVIGGINMRTRHIRKTPQNAGQRIQYEASIDASNVMIVDPKTKKRSRIGTKVDAKGKKTRIAKRSGEAVVAVKPKASAAADDKKATTKTTPKKKADKKSDAAPSKKPFWSRLGGTVDGEEGEVKEASHMNETHASPRDATSQVRTSGRGS